MQGHGALIFSIFALYIFAVTAGTVSATRKRGHRVQLLDVVPQWGGVLIVLPMAVEMRRTVEIPIDIVAVGLMLWGAWGHFRRLTRT